VRNTQRGRERERERGKWSGGRDGNFPFCAAGALGLQADLIAVTSSLSITPKPHPVLQIC